MSCREATVAGVCFVERVGIDGHDGVQTQAVDGRLIVGVDAREISLHDGAAGGMPVADGSLCLGDCCA